MVEKTPLGLKPRSIWVEQRKSEVMGAIARYIQADLPVPVEWIQEWNAYCSNSTKRCPKCMNENLVLTRTLSLKYCTSCNTEIPWNLDKDQPQLK